MFSDFRRPNGIVVNGEYRCLILWYQCIYMSFAPTTLGNFPFAAPPPALINQSINQSFIWVRRHGPYTGTHTHAHNTQ